MTTKAAAANGASQADAKELALIDKDLAEIRAIHKDLARKRAEGRKITARIDRNLKEIQAIINRVAATH